MILKFEYMLYSLVNLYFCHKYDITLHILMTITPPIHFKMSTLKFNYKQLMTRCMKYSLNSIIFTNLFNAVVFY